MMGVVVVPRVLAAAAIGEFVVIAVDVQQSGRRVDGRPRRTGAARKRNPRRRPRLQADWAGRTRPSSPPQIARRAGSALQAAHTRVGDSEPTARPDGHKTSVSASQTHGTSWLDAVLLMRMTSVLPFTAERIRGPMTCRDSGNLAVCPRKRAPPQARSKVRI